MLQRKNKIFMYGLIALSFSIACIGQVNAANYENYFGIKMTNEEYDTLLNLGFSEDEIYYMNEQTYLENKNLDANLVSENHKYYKTIYTALDGNAYSVEVTKEEYKINRQPIHVEQLKQHTSKWYQNFHKMVLNIDIK